MKTDGNTTLDPKPNKKTKLSLTLRRSRVSQTNQDQDSALPALDNALKALQLELDNIQSQYAAQSRKHGQVCALALKDCLSGLLHIVSYVNRADLNLIKWYDTGDGIKSVLRVVGVDRRTDAVISKQTDKIKSKVAKVERKFDNASNTVTESLHLMEVINKGIETFSVSSVGAVSDQAITASDKCKQDNAVIEKQMKVERVYHEKAQRNIEQISQSIESSQAEQRLVQGRKDLWSRASSMSATAAFGTGVGSLAFPLSLLATGTLLVASTLTAGVAREHDATIKALEEEEADLNRSLSQSQETLNTLEAQLATLSAQQDVLEKARAEANALSDRTSAVHREAQSMMDEVRAIRLVLVDIKGRLTAIALELHECGYAETRADIATKLQGTLTIIDGARTKLKMQSLNSKVKGAMTSLLGVSTRTPQMITIMASCK